jgi:hypothetical protein
VKRPEACTPVPKTYREKKAPRRLKASRGNTVPHATLTVLERRSGGACEARTEDCWGSIEHPHHRRLKAQRVDHDPKGLLAVCFACHRGLHARVDWSYRHGLLLAAGDDPELLVVGCSYSCNEDHRTGGTDMTTSVSASDEREGDQR